MAQPQSLNPLINNDFKFSISRLPNVEFWAQKANIPGFQLFDAGQATAFGRLPLAGNSVQWEPLVLSFMPDEHLRNYMEVFDWCMTIAFPESFTQFNPQDLVSDATFSLLDSNKRPKLNVNYTNVFPYMIDGINFDTTQEMIQYQHVNVSFLYDRWTYERL
jgi:hypothetical protein